MDTYPQPDEQLKQVAKDLYNNKNIQ